MSKVNPKNNVVEAEVVSPVSEKSKGRKKVLSKGWFFPNSSTTFKALAGIFTGAVATQFLSYAVVSGAIPTSIATAQVFGNIAFTLNPIAGITTGLIAPMVIGGAIVLAPIVSRIFDAVKPLHRNLSRARRLIKAINKSLNKGKDIVLSKQDQKLLKEVMEQYGKNTKFGNKMTKYINKLGKKSPDLLDELNKLNNSNVKAVPTPTKPKKPSKGQEEKTLDAEEEKTLDTDEEKTQEEGKVEEEKPEEKSEEKTETDEAVKDIPTQGGVATTQTDGVKPPRSRSVYNTKSYLKKMSEKKMIDGLNVSQLNELLNLSESEIQRLNKIKSKKGELGKINAKYYDTVTNLTSQIISKIKIEIGNVYLNVVSPYAGQNIAEGKKKLDEIISQGKKKPTFKK